MPPPISAHDGLRPQGPLGSIRFSGAPNEGPTAILEAAADPGFRSRGLGGLQTPNLAVTQAIEDEGQELSGHRHPGLELPAARRAAVVVGSELGASSILRDRLDGSP